MDYVSNFIEIAPLQRDTNSGTVIKHMKQTIARYGIMDTLISDNGPQYASAEFKEFTTEYGIDHITSSPLHQQTNGLAERAVQTVKNMIKKCYETGEDIYLSLLELRNTPRDSDIGSPMQRLMGRRAKTLIPITQNLRKPESANTEKVTSALMGYREKQKYYYDKNTKVKEDIQPGDTVRIHTPTGWKPAEYVESTEHPRSHIVKAGNTGREYRRNTDMLMKTKEKPHVIIPKDPVVEMPYFIPERQNVYIPPTKPIQREHRESVPRVSENKPEKPSTARKKGDLTSDNGEKKSSFGREIRKPKHLDDFV